MIAEKNIFKSESDSIRNFMSNLQEVEKNVQNDTFINGEKNFKKIYSDFISQISSQIMGNDFPRFFIIDNYSRLDYTTKRVLQHYIHNYLCDDDYNPGKEVWLVTEPIRNNEKLSTHVLLNEKKIKNNFLSQYRIEPFTINEKKNLVKLIGGDSNWIKFSNAQFICNGQGVSKSWIYERLKKSKNEATINTFSSIDFLYLLSLTTFPNQYYFSQKNIRIDFNKDIDKHKVYILSLFLKGSKFSKLELNNLFKDIIKEYYDLIIIENDKLQNKRIAPLNDVSITLLNSEKELNLPNKGIGHLFWLLHWSNVLKNYPYEIYWIEKLSNHLLNADYKIIPNEHSDKYIEEILDACTYVIEGSINTGLLFNIFDILEIAKDLLLCYNKVNIENEKHNLIILCWKSYSLNKDDRIINLFVELSNKNVSELTLNDSLYELYLQMIPAPLLGNNDNIKEFSNWIISYKKGKQLKDYIKPVVHLG